MALSEISEDRFVRQRELVPSERLAELLITVIGVGAIGRQVALQLAAIGVRKLQLVDFDRVDDTNITTQGYLQSDVGVLKVHATAEASKRLDPSVEVTLVDARYTPKLDIGPVVFCCVDSIETRAAIWRSARRRAEFWADGRMLGEVIRVLVAADESSREHYPKPSSFSGSGARPLYRPQHDLRGQHRSGPHGAPVRQMASWPASGCRRHAQSACGGTRGESNGYVVVI